MKEIKAFIRPNKVTTIVNHLKDAGFENITLSLAEGTGKFQGEKAFVSQMFSITDSEITKLEMVVYEDDVKTILKIISEYGKTINPGDGIIYVSNVEKAFRIKTGKDVKLDDKG